MFGLHIVYIKLLLRACHEQSPDARRIVVEAIDHGTVAVHQNGPTVSIHLVRLDPDTEQKQHAPVPAVLQGHVKFGAGPLKERGRGDEEDKVHSHVLVVAPEWPAVDKLCAKKVLVPAEEAQGEETSGGDSRAGNGRF